MICSGCAPRSIRSSGAQQLLKPKPVAVNDRVGLSRNRSSRLFEISQRGAALPALKKPHERTRSNRRFAYVQKRPVIGHPTLLPAEALNMGNLLGFWAISRKSATLWQEKMGTETLYFLERVWFNRAGSPSSSG
jgi:hypothetical protein